MVSRPVAVEVVPALLSKSLGPNVPGEKPAVPDGSIYKANDHVSQPVCLPGYHSGVDTSSEKSSKSLGPTVTGELQMNLERSFDRENGPVFPPAQLQGLQTQVEVMSESSP